jgi:hypothetical protein
VGPAALVAVALWPIRSEAGPQANADVSEAVSQCVDAHASVQELRRKHLLLQAREALKTCLAAQCPALVRSDCYGWSDEIERETPSVIFHVTSQAVPLVDVHVYVDGGAAEIPNDGTPLRLDPGRHTYRVEHAGHKPVSRDVVVFAGQRFLQINVDLEPSADARVQAAPPVPESYRPVPAATYVFLALGVAGAAGFAGFGLSGTTARHNLESSCSPRCSDDQVSSVRWKFLAADVSLGIGAASLLASGLAYVLRPAKERPVTVSVIPARGGIMGGLSFRGM